MRRWRIHWKQSEKSLTPDLRSKGDASQESQYPIFVTLVAAD